MAKRSLKGVKTPFIQYKRRNITAVIIGTVLALTAVPLWDASASRATLTNEEFASSQLNTLTFSARANRTNPSDDWKNRLFAPTQVVALDNKWFIVDCWHNRVIWSTDLNTPIAQWQTVDDNLAGPHSISFGAGYFAIEDTGRHEVNFYQFNTQDQTFIKRHSLWVGGRPHRIHYVESDNSFYVLSSETQKLHRISMNGSSPQLAHTYNLSFLNGRYSRSFTVLGKNILFVSQNREVILAEMNGDTLTERSRHTVPVDFADANDIFFTGNGYIMTATSNAIGFSPTLNELSKMKNLSNELGFKDRGYFVSQYGSTIIVPEIGTNSAVHMLALKDAKTLVKVGVLHEFGPGTTSSLARSAQMPK